jgi:hypothetical protein
MLNGTPTPKRKFYTVPATIKIAVYAYDTADAEMIADALLDDVGELVNELPGVYSMTLGPTVTMPQTDIEGDAKGIQSVTSDEHEGDSPVVGEVLP